MSSRGPPPGWQARLVAELPTYSIPVFLTDLQAFVAAVRDGQDWQDHVTPMLVAHGSLAFAYLDINDPRLAQQIQHALGA